MAHAAYLRDQARELRVERRLTIDELAERLALSRSTIYCWVRDLPIPGSGSGEGWPESARRKGNKAMQEKYRVLRVQAYQEGIDTFSTLASEPTFRDFICLYIGEGYKRSRNVVSICNSDPTVLKLADVWIRRFASGRLSYSFQYHADQSVSALTTFWAEELDVEPSAIRALQKSNSSQLRTRTWRCAYGVLSITAADTLFRARMQAWMECIRASWV